MKLREVVDTLLQSVFSVESAFYALQFALTMGVVSLVASFANGWTYFPTLNLFLTWMGVLLGVGLGCGARLLSPPLSLSALVGAIVAAGLSLSLFAGLLVLKADAESVFGDFVFPFLLFWLLFLALTHCHKLDLVIAGLWRDLRRRRRL